MQRATRASSVPENPRRSAKARNVATIHSTMQITTSTCATQPPPLIISAIASRVSLIVGARGDPTIETRTANTRILVNDGETSVMGGIYTRNTGVTYNKVPVLGDLPVLGWLFKNRRESDTRGELLIFITPKITNRANLRCGAE